MKVVGLITEYNPFHNGHKYHLEKSKEVSGADYSVALMSGNFLQRGEPSLLDKWERAKIAVKEGVDLVIELPTIFSCSSAEFFAFGSTKLLDSLGIIDSICFGSEDGKIERLKLISDLLANETTEFRNTLKAWLNKGYPFPMARQRALEEYLSNRLDDIGFLNSPNNILGIEYLKSLKLLNSTIRPLTIKRIQADYNSTEIKGRICSATAIRNLLQNDYDGLEVLARVVPVESYRTITNAIKDGRGPIFAKDLEQIIFYRLRSISINELKAIHDINEGLENRLKKGALLSSRYNELVEFLKTKRYTRTRLQRILIKAILGITKNDVLTLGKEEYPQYIRVLGFNHKGAELLRKIKERSKVPIITNLKRYEPKNDCEKRMMDIDTIATDTYTLLYKNPQLSIGGLDYIKGPFIKHKE